MATLFYFTTMAEVGRIEVTVGEIECPFCGAECDDERTYRYSDIIEYINITCDECEGVFELYICADVDISITEVTPPRKPPESIDPLGTGLPDVNDPNQIKLFDE